MSKTTNCLSASDSPRNQNSCSCDHSPKHIELSVCLGLKFSGIIRTFHSSMLGGWIQQLDMWDLWNTFAWDKTRAALNRNLHWDQRFRHVCLWTLNKDMFSQTNIQSMWIWQRTDRWLYQMLTCWFDNEPTDIHFQNLRLIYIRTFTHSGKWRIYVPGEF